MTQLYKSDILLMAVDTAGTIQVGNYEDALAVLSLLNPLQAMVFHEHLRSYLSEQQHQQFLSLATDRMNDEGYYEDVRELGEKLMRLPH